MNGPKALFDAIRLIKGAPLTQDDVDRINRALNAPEIAKVSQIAIDLIHSFESLKLTAYKDPGSENGLPITIGWGSTSDLNGRPIKLGTVWTREQADAKFAQDIEAFSRDVRALAEPATQNQIDALTSFAYNVGLEAFKNSTLLKLHKAGDYAGAKAQFARWNKNDGKVMNGLIRRRAAEAALYGEA